MVKSYIKRIAATAVMTAVCLGATMTLGLPQIAYAVKTDNKEVMMTINGVDVLKDEYADYYKYCKVTMEKAYGVGEYIWSMYPEALQQLVAATDSNCLYARIVVNKFNELGLNVDKQRNKPPYGTAWDFKQSIMQTKSALKQFTTITFDEYLEEMGIDEQMYGNIFAQGYYLEALDDYYFGENGEKAPAEEKIKEEFNKYYKSKHILIMNIDDNGQKLEGDELVEKQNLIKKIQQELADGADFDELMKKYSEDTGLLQNPDGYIFQDDGSFVDEFVDGTKSLKEGEYSKEPVISDFGWHIIKREALTEEDYKMYRPEIVYNLTGMTMQGLVETWMEEADVKYPEGHEDLKISDVLGEEAGKLPSIDDLLSGASGSSSADDEDNIVNDEQNNNESSNS